MSDLNLLRYFKKVGRISSTSGSKDFKQMSNTRRKMFSCAFHSFHAWFVMNFEAFCQHFYCKWLFLIYEFYCAVYHRRQSRLIFQTERESEVATLSVCATETQHVWVSYHKGSTAQLGGTTSWVPEPKPCQHFCQKRPKLPLIKAVVWNVSGETLVKQNITIMNK